MISVGRYAAYALIQVSGEDRSRNARCAYLSLCAGYVPSTGVLFSDHAKPRVGYKNIVGSLWQVHRILSDGGHLTNPVDAASKDQEEAREIMGNAAEVSASYWLMSRRLSHR